MIGGTSSQQAAALVPELNCARPVRQRLARKAHEQRSSPMLRPLCPSAVATASNTSSFTSTPLTWELRAHKLKRDSSGLRHGRRRLRVASSIETTPVTRAVAPVPGPKIAELQAAISSAFFSGITAGTPTPLGASVVPDKSGINFAVHTPGVAVSLCLWTPDDFDRGVVTHEIPLDPLTNKTGTVWHVKLGQLAECFVYGYRVDGGDKVPVTQRFDKTEILLDPYAKAVVSRKKYMELGEDGTTWPQMAGAVPKVGVP